MLIFKLNWHRSSAKRTANLKRFGNAKYPVNTRNNQQRDLWINIDTSYYFVESYLSFKTSFFPIKLCKIPLTYVIFFFRPMCVASKPELEQRCTFVKCTKSKELGQLFNLLLTTKLHCVETYS